MQRFTINLKLFFVRWPFTFWPFDRPTLQVIWYRKKVLKPQITSIQKINFPQIFVLVILFGLFNGLVFLPVLLGLLGPMKNVEHRQSPEQNENGIGIIKLSPKKKIEETEGDNLEMKSLVVWKHYLETT